MIIEKTLNEIRKNVPKINARNDAADSKADANLTPTQRVWKRRRARWNAHRADRFKGSLPAVDTSKDGCENLPTGLEEK